MADRDSWWTTGQLVSSLGLSPVVLRTWDSRYGLGPARRASGGQRLYGPREWQRLRRMTSLEPAVVLLWSMTSYTADLPLLNEVGRLKIPACPAGPGWYSFRPRIGPIVNTLEDAMRTVFLHTRRVST